MLDLSICPTCQEEIDTLTEVQSQIDEVFYCSEKCRLEDEGHIIKEVL